MLIPRAGIILGAALVVSACSDGGGLGSLNYSGPTALVAINSESQADSVASTVVELESTSTVLSDATAIVPIGVATSGARLQLPLSTLGTLAKKYADQAMASTPVSTTLLAGVTTTQTNNCSDGGSVTVTTNKSVPAEVNPDDSISMTFNNCIEGTELTRGSVSVTINAFNQVTNDFAADFGFSNLRITNRPTGDYVWLQGGYTAGFTGDSTTTPLVVVLNGSSLIVQARTNGVVSQALLSDFSFVDTLAINGDFSFDHNYTIASSGLGGSIMVETITPFMVYSGDSYPTVGRVVVTGAAGASIRLTALDNLTALLEYDLGGDGLYGNETIDPSAKVVNWADF